MKEWLKAQGISYRRLAASMGSSAATVCKKLNGETPWQQRDLLFFHDKFGLSSDFVLGIPCVPSETEKPAEHRVDMQTTTTGPARTSAIVPWKPKEGQQYEHGSRNRR